MTSASKVSVKNRAAGECLARLLVDQNRLDELRERADSGDRFAAERFADELVRRNRRDELRQRSDSGDPVAGGRLCAVLRGEGRTDEEIDVLRAHMACGPAAHRLVSLLTKLGRINEAVAVLEPHVGAADWPASFLLMTLLIRQSDGDGLRKLADTG